MEYKQPLEVIQDIMDIEDYKRFHIRLYDVDTGRFITKEIAYFYKNQLTIEFESLTALFKMMSDVKSYTKNFRAEIPVRSYKYEDIDMIDVPILKIDSTFEISLVKGYAKANATGIPLVSVGNTTFFTAFTR